MLECRKLLNVHGAYQEGYRKSPVSFVDSISTAVCFSLDKTDSFLVASSSCLIWFGGMLTNLINSVG